MRAGTRVDHRALANRAHRRARGIVEFDALMLLEVATHRLAITVGRVDVRIAFFIAHRPAQDQHPVL